MSTDNLAFTNFATNAKSSIDFSEYFDYSHFGDVIPLISNALCAAIILGIVGGLIGIFVSIRNMSFAVHGIAELSFTGAACALLLGGSVLAGSIIGSVVAGVLLTVLSWKNKDSNSVIGVIIPFGLGLGILFLSLYPGRSANKFSLLTGQIISVNNVQLNNLALLAGMVTIVVAFCWKRLFLSSVDPLVALSRGININIMSLLFMVLLSVSVALSIQIVGALLVLSLIVTPAAAALQITVTPPKVVILSVLFAVTASLGGVLIAAGSTIPVSPFVTSISFVIYIICTATGGYKKRHRSQSTQVVASTL